MKKILKYSLFALLLISFLPQIAAQVELNKRVEQEFKVNARKLLDLKSSFGKIHVNNWDKNEFKVVVDIRAKSSTEAKAQKLLDRININIVENSTAVMFQTIFDGGTSKGNEEFEVVYTVHMPSINPLKVKHSFGDVFLDNRVGLTQTDVSYGALKAKTLGENTTLKISFGSADINEIVSGNLNSGYSKIYIDRAGSLDVEQQFSQLEIISIANITIESKYGDVKLGDAGIINADVQFSGFSIESLSESIVMQSKYVSGFEINRLAPKFTLVDLNGEFGSYKIRLDNSIKANFEGYFSFSDLKNSGVEIDYNYRVKENNKSEYRGKINGGDPSKMIRIKSSYGDCRLFY